MGKLQLGKAALLFLTFSALASALNSYSCSDKLVRFPLLREISYMWESLPQRYGDWGDNTPFPICPCLSMLLGVLLEDRTGPKQVKGELCLPWHLQQLE